MIEFHLDRASGVASYLQLVHQVKRALRLGLLQPGDRLPTAKEAVAQVGINPNTVLKSYRELEREGLVEGRPGLGTFVLPGPLVRPAANTGLRRDLDAWLAAARAAGLDREDIDALIDAALTDTFREDHAP
ncbi:GntR family transcriptional regulator [Pilimelia columellifera]|uniref:GntR family transcriptional regulator n=1 Tax=Pilimelia columellifera subsp. columellifera TaxID=706583 RepID=A0ABP6AVT7_9ACTN